MDIQAKSLKALEWDKLTLHLSGQCETATAQAESQTLSLASQVDDIHRLLNQTVEAASLVEHAAAPSFHKLPAIEHTLARLKAKACLDPTELLQIKTLLSIAKVTRSSLSLLPSQAYPELGAFISKIHAPADIAEAITLAIDETGDIKDEASEELAKLRRQRRQLDERIKSELAKIIHSPDFTKVLQEPIFTQRDNRFVVPVIASARESMPGIVHDSSASGLTIYIEPSHIVELSNSVRLKDVEIQKELVRILEELTSRIRPHTDELTASYRTLIELDKIFARARLGIKYDGTAPTISDSQDLQLFDARHPLLVLQDKSQSVIGNDIRLTSTKEDQSIRTLIITGPNTGGKTVYLKTVGLLSIMLRAGLMLPVKKGSIACVFNNILADIGDEQSLEQSLSTFSSHLNNIGTILQIANHNSLVLLDEIGAGTDPKEGAALAQAILEFLYEKGSTSIVTTHLVELKTLGYTKPGFVNGSFEFDETNLAPTFRFHLGVPGASQAVNIAQRLGLAPKVIERTRSLLKNASDTVSDTMLALEARLAVVIAQEGLVEQREQQTTELLAGLRAKSDALETDRERVRNNYAQQLDNEFTTAKQLIKELTAELQRTPNLAKTQAAKDQLESLQNEIPWLKSDQSTRLINKQAGFAPGQKVFIKPLGQWGKIEKLSKDFAAQSDPSVYVRIGDKRLTVKVSQLQH